MKQRLLFYLLFIYIIYMQLYPHTSPSFSYESFASTPKNSIRIVSYNIHFGASANGKPAISIISDFLSAVSPDILCLQEVDRNTIRSLFLDQTSKLNEDLSMEIAYGETDSLAPGTTGNLILSRYPILYVENKSLPSFKYKRNALLATVKTPIGNINVINTHLSLSRDVRKKQIEIIRDWILQNRLPTILAGDFNASDINELKPLLLILKDPAEAEDKAHITTFENKKYNSRIDYVLIPKTYFVKSYNVPRFHFSDHYPVIVDLY
ncbi:endonuclease/exonuclease/phosphatase family protein [Wukongibacter baidiensis]|uniref:endonuclease/exonuclease/phosphatase family protein n=1 Tax=Wukongibacter baidiensis TaxID=1723361 RepID=UPI003D7F5FAD